jgi:hypothetical protein
MWKSQASCKTVMAIQSSFFFSWVEFYIMKIEATVLDFMSLEASFKRAENESQGLNK